MSYFYYQVFKKIQSQLSIFQLLYLQILQILFYVWTVQLLFDFYKISTSHPDAINGYLTQQVTIFLIARSFTVYLRHRTYLITPIIKQTFPEKDRQLLVTEIEESLKKSLEFTKWSCGILSTVLVLVTTLFFNIGLKTYDKIISENALIKELQILSSNLNELFLLFTIIVALIVGVILAYYFILQLFSFHKKFVLKVLKNCDYHSPYYLSNCSRWKTIMALAKEVFFLDSIVSFTK